MQETSHLEKTRDNGDILVSLLHKDDYVIIQMNMNLPLYNQSGTP